MLKLRPSTLHGSPAGFIQANLAHRLREYSVVLHSREMFVAVCDADVEAVTIACQLCRLHPGKYEAELAEILEDIVSRSIPRGCTTLHATRLPILPVSFSDFIRVNTGQLAEKCGCLSSF
jgi:hypothetical protein